MSTFSFRQRAALTLLLFALLLLLVPQTSHNGDMYYWFTWGCYIHDYGLGNVYQVADNNYNPLYHYILWLYANLMGNCTKLFHYRHWLKSLTLLFDFAGAFWAASLVPERERRFGLALLLLLNIGYLYNTLIWVQVDAIYTFFAFGAVVLAVQQRAVGSVLCFVLAVASKTQAIIFLPPLLLLWAPQWWHRPWRLVQALLAGALLAVLVLAPFIWWSKENYLPRIIAINLGATNTFPVVSMNAYNLWHLLSPDVNPASVSDLVPIAGLSYRTWGFLLFCGASALALLPLLAAAAARLRSRPGAPVAAPEAAVPAPELALVLLSCGLIPLLFAFFNTQMHERYWHAAVLFLAAYGFVRRDYLLFALVSVAYFLNLEGVLHYLDLTNYGVLVFKSWFVAALFGVAIALGLAKLYGLAAWRNNWQHITRVDFKNTVNQVLLR